MQRFFLIKKVVGLVTVQDLIAPMLYFRCTNIVSGKKREVAYNQAQKFAACV